ERHVPDMAEASAVRPLAGAGVEHAFPGGNARGGTVREGGHRRPVEVELLPQAARQDRAQAQAPDRIPRRKRLGMLVAGLQVAAGSPKGVETMRLTRFPVRTMTFAAVLAGGLALVGPGVRADTAADVASLKAEAKAG